MTAKKQFKLKVFLTVSIYCVVIAAISSVDAATTVTPVPDSLNPQVGATVCVQIKVNDAVDLYAAGFDFSYNPGVLDYLSASEGALLNQNDASTIMQVWYLNGDKSSGKMVVGISRLGNSPGVSGSGTLLTLCFRVIGSACPVCRYEFENASLEGAEQDSKLDAIWNSAKLKVYDPNQPDFDRDRINDACDNCTLQANTDQRDTDNDGYGNICDPDIKNDCYVNYGDLALLKAAFGACTDNPKYNPNADFDGNGCVNYGDLAILKKYFGKKPGPGLGNCK